MRMRRRMRIRINLNRELIPIPLPPLQPNQRLGLWFPSRMVEEPVGHVVVYREFLDLGVYHGGLGGFFGEGG